MYAVSVVRLVSDPSANSALRGTLVPSEQTRTPLTVFVAIIITSEFDSYSQGLEDIPVDVSDRSAHELLAELESDRYS